MVAMCTYMKLKIFLNVFRKNNKKNISVKFFYVLSSILVYCKQLEARLTKVKCWTLLYNHVCLVHICLSTLTCAFFCDVNYVHRASKIDYSYYLCIQRGIQKSEIIKVWWYKNTEESLHLLIFILTNSLNSPSVTIKVRQLSLYPISFVLQIHWAIWHNFI